ncbi:MAG: DUF3124 domain-containing protein, partial [Desulfobacterales bacterium]
MKTMAKNIYTVNFVLALIMTVLISSAGQAAGDIQLFNGQTVYVSIYSHIYSGVKARPFDLAAILSIRNTDINQSINIVSVKYYDTEGKLLKEYLDKPI